MVYTIPVAGYTLNGKAYNTGCIFAVSPIPDSANMYILGDAFLRNFYSVYDFKTKHVIMAVSSGAPPGTSIEKLISGWVIFIIVTFSLLAFIILICLIIKCRQRRNARKQAKDP
mmetsp:Transcript_32628/g.23569  ORF Transcript_32628/g.23569 Transcript_32628/m.23569 type:complete len:114 (-) Transcript_32628:254-595(-)